MGYEERWHPPCLSETGRVGQLRANVWQQKSCTALSNNRKNGQKMEKALARKKGVGLKDLSKKPEKSPRMMKMY